MPTILRRAQNPERSRDRGKTVTQPANSESDCRLAGISGEDKISIDVRCRAVGRQRTRFQDPMAAALQGHPSQLSWTEAAVRTASICNAGPLLGSPEDRRTRKSRTDLGQHLQTLWSEIREVQKDASNVTAGTRQTCRDTTGQWICFQVDRDDRGVRRHATLRNARATSRPCAINKFTRPATISSGSARAIRLGSPSVVRTTSST